MGHTKGFHTSNDFDSRPNTRTEQIDTWTRLISLQKPLQNQKTSPLLFFKTNIFSQVTLKPPNIIFFHKISSLPFPPEKVSGGIFPQRPLEECHRVQLPTLALAVPPSQAASRLPEIGDSRRKAVGSPVWVVGWRDVFCYPGGWQEYARRRSCFLLLMYFLHRNSRIW